MDEAARSRVPWGLLGMMALVAAVELALAAQPLRFSDTASLSWRLGVEAARREAPRCEVACLGDSLVKIGVLPRVIEAGTGKRAYNFAMAQAPAPATYFVLRRLLEAGGRPEAVVVDFKPSVLAGGPRLSLRLWQEVLDLRETLELAKASGNLRFLLEIARGRLLASSRARLEIREAVRSALGGESSPTHRTNRLALRNWTVNLGAHLNSSRPGWSGTVAPEVHRKLRSDEWRCHRVNEVYVDRLFALAGSRGIPVYWLIPPLSPELQGRREGSGVDAAFVAFVRAVQARHPGVTVVDGRRAGYEAASFADPTHLNGRGSLALSRDLAAILKTPEDRPRWIDLPPFRDRPEVIPGEDIDQSRLSVEAIPSRR